MANKAGNIGNAGLKSRKYTGNKIAREIILLNEFQYKLHKLAQSYFNMGLGKKGYLLYPMCKSLSDSNVKLIEELLLISKKLSINFPFRNTNQASNNWHDDAWRQMVSKPELAISAFYLDLDESIGLAVKKYSIARKKILKKKLKRWEPSGPGEQDAEYLSPVRELSDFAEQKLRKHLAGFYAQGSIADFTFVKSWSDLDTIAVIRKEVFRDPSRVKELRKLLYSSRIFQAKIDPLQHHGHHLITEIDLAYYPQQLMPLAAFNKSVSLFREDRGMAFFTRDCRQESWEEFMWFSDDLAKSALDFAKGENGTAKNAYMLKFLLHKISLYPTLFLAAKGEYVYKGDSFRIARKYFSRKAWRAIEIATLHRKNWKGIGSCKAIFTLFSYNPVLAVHLNAALSPKARSLASMNRIAFKELMGSVVALAAEAQKKA